jgi:dissimilatory sulfite reductase (desulfoviridin) alpha/beta subunit
LATLKVNLISSCRFFCTGCKEEHVEDLAFVGQTNSAVYTSADSSSELSCSTRCIVQAADFDVSLNRLSHAKAR